jgi:hypothetical protein
LLGIGGIRDWKPLPEYNCIEHRVT